MKRDKVEELHFIARFEVIPSIVERGVLSRRGAKKLYRDGRLPPSVADQDVLRLRRTKSVPGGMYLFGYANLYFNGRNAMLYRRKAQWDNIGVIRIAPDVLDVPRAVISDRNAASESARFHASPGGLAHLVHDEVFARWWKQDRDSRQKMMAELLVPAKVDANHVIGVRVRNDDCARRLLAIAPGTSIAISPYLFFDGPPP